MKRASNIKLLPSEAAQHRYDAVVSLATVYAGSPPTEEFEQRVNAIFKKNPWLASRLKTSSECSLSLEVSSDLTMKPYFEIVHIDDIIGTGETGALLQSVYEIPLKPALSDLFAKQGFKCIDNSEPLFKIRLCIGNDNTFVLLLSMSHIIGDGATIYRIYQMLSSDEDIVALNPVRVPSFEEISLSASTILGSSWLPERQETEGDLIRALAESEAMCTTPNSRLLTGLAKSVTSPDGVERTSSYSEGVYKVDMNWVSNRKEKHVATQNVPWISTNDILSSWFMSSNEPSVGLVAVNTRNHIDQLTPDHVGNYQVGVAFTKKEYSSPESFRYSLSQFPNNRKWTGKTEQVDSITLISNWSSFYTHINIGDNCHQIVHFPLLPPELSSPVLIDSTMVIFYSNKGELAIGIGTNRLDRLLGSDVIARPLFS